MTDEMQTFSDKLMTAMMETNEVIAETVAKSKELGLNLGVKQGEDYFLNTKLISKAVERATLKILMGTATYDDFKAFVLSMADSALAAERFADES